LEKLAERAASCGDSYVETRALVGFVVIRAAEDAHACRPLMDRLRSLWERVEDPGMRAFAHGQWLSLQNSMSGWKAGLAEEHAADIEHVRATGDPLLTASLRMDHAHLQAGSSQYAESNRTTRECLPALLQSGRLLRYQHGRDLLAVNHAFLGEWGTALDILNESIDTAQKNVAPQRSLMPLVFKAWIHLTAMDFEGVRDICAVALPALAAPFMLDRRYIAMRLAASAELGLGRCDEALEQLTSVRNAERERPVTYSWYWRMPLQIDVAEACLATGNIARAREEANRALELTQTAAERTWQALAWEVSARVAFQEDDPVRAEKDVQAALRLIEGFELAIAAWRVYATASMLDRSHLDRSRQVLRRLSDSLHSRPDLQKTFMSSAAVSSLLGNGAGQSAHAGPA
jgi:tetratricopeptide (TPR) repeat protein